MAPAMAGQMTPDQMGLPMQGESALFQQMMGNPLPPGEELDQLAGMPPAGD